MPRGSSSPGTGNSSTCGLGLNSRKMLVVVVLYLAVTGVWMQYQWGRKGKETELKSERQLRDLTDSVNKLEKQVHKRDDTQQELALLIKELVKITTGSHDPPSATSQEHPIPTPKKPLPAVLPQFDKDTARRPTCHVTVKGEPCRFPFVYKGSIRTSCVEGWCPTEMDLHTGEPVTTGKCIENIEDCPTEGSSVDVPGSCDKTGSSGCDCKYSNGKTLRIPCGTATRISCTDLCKAVGKRFTEGTSWEARHEPTIQECQRLISSWGDHKGVEIGSVLSYHPPSYKEQQHHGSGIVIASGGERTPSAVSNALFIKTVLKSRLPIQIWSDSDEKEPRGLMRLIAAAHDITFHRFPEECGYSRFDWNNRWQKDSKNILPDHAGRVVLKPLALLFSSFETVVSFDDDAIPAIDPIDHLTYLSPKDPATAKPSAIFWRDIWSLWKDAHIWTKIGVDFPGGRQRHFPSQDSGSMIINKGQGKAWDALCVANYLNYHHKVFYPAIYNGGYRTEKNGFESIGAGDKDTFQVAWIILKEPHQLMGPVSFVAREGEACGGALGQPDPDGTIVILHLNGHKMRYKDWASGQWKKWGPSAIGLEEVLSLRRPEVLANRYDGRARTQVTWKTPAHGHSYCLKWHKQDITKLSAHIPWDIQTALTEHTEKIFGSPYVTEYMTMEN
eukprot:TRINITY_DN6062_c0_g6_i1.p1 TRINITY_DN6062_c0_g6~~TRINITY_DN6062_c0_g6_i1.p1  ORF type:complete len:697 (+),score=109.66 TRINITY_DN6062_c0_g6_i1:80-2092(+)